MLNQVPFYFLRHGETDWNARGVMQGQTDIDLSDIGRRQAEAIAPTVASLPIKSICCSSLIRARRTAEIVNENSNREIFEFDELRECRFGIYEGKPSNGSWREEWVKGGVLPDGESYQEYLDRALSGLNKALSKPGPVLVVAHGGTFWTIQRHALKEDAVRIPNCVLFQLEPPSASYGHWAVQQIAAPSGHQLIIGEAAKAN